MNTTLAKSPSRISHYARFATPLVLDPPRHCGLPVIHLAIGKHLLGTSPECSVQIGADDVQPHHAVIVVSQHRTVVKAIDARTWVNDGPVTEMALRPGDRLSIGPITFRVRAATPDELADFAQVNQPPLEDDNSRHLETAVKKSGSAAPVEIHQKAQAAQVSTNSKPLGSARKPQTPDNADAGNSTNQSQVSTNSTKPVDRHVELNHQQTSTTETAASSSNQLTRETPSPLTNHAKPNFVSEWGTSAQSMDVKLQAIERQLADLRGSHQSQKVGLIPASSEIEAATTANKQAAVAAEVERPSTAEPGAIPLSLQDRLARVAEREAELARNQAKLADERDQLRETTDATRKKLDEEYARHLALWQEWDAAYRRTSGELNSQLQEIDQRRSALLAETDRLANERTEVQRLQAEHERIRRSLAAEQAQLNADRSTLQSLRSELEETRQRQVTATEECERLLTAEKQQISVLQQELQEARRQLDQDRSDFLADRAADALRRERELREHLELRERLNRDHERIQLDRLEVNELRRSVETKLATLELESTPISKPQWSAIDQLSPPAIPELPSSVREPSHAEALPHASTTHREASESTATNIDWFAAPYMNLVSPPPVPQNFEENNDTSRVFSLSAELGNDNSSRTVEISPGSKSPSFGNAGSIPNSEVLAPETTTDRVTSVAAELRTPSAAPVRFWEDNTLYDTSMLPSLPSTENSLQTPSSHSPTSMAGIDHDFSNFNTEILNDRDGLDPSIGNRAPRSWIRSRQEAQPATEAQFDGLELAVATAEVPPVSVDETLADVEREFGTPLQEQSSTPPSAAPSLPSWWVEGTSRGTSDQIADDPGAERTNIYTPPTGDIGFSATTSVGNADQQTESSVDPMSISTLRLQLASMFNIPAKSPEFSSNEHAAAVEHSFEVVTSSTTNEDFGDSQVRLDSTDLLQSVPQSIVSPAEMTMDNSALQEPEASANDHASPEATNEKSDDSKSDAAAESDEDESVEAYMARLLSRSRGGAEVSTTEVSSFKQAQKTSDTYGTPHQPAAAPSIPQNFDPADRSHLLAAPKHKQDMKAAREDLQSFRQVAHQSARSALARHTTKALMSALVGKLGLLGASVLATVSFFGAPLLGIQTPPWKGLACSFALILSAYEVLRSWRELRKWKQTGMQLKESSRTIAAAPKADTVSSSSTSGSASATSS